MGIIGGEIMIFRMKNPIFSKKHIKKHLFENVKHGNIHPQHDFIEILNPIIFDMGNVGLNNKYAENTC
jgi:hypothetical protein